MDNFFVDNLWITMKTTSEKFSQNVYNSVDNLWITIKFYFKKEKETKRKNKFILLLLLLLTLTRFERVSVDLKANGSEITKI